MGGTRETRIDLIRGLSLLMIFVGHATFVFSEAFQQSRGFSDASELFVMMAGMSAALAYFPLARPFSFRATAAKTLRRAGKLYGIHVALVLVLLLASCAPVLKNNPAIMATFGLTDFWRDSTHLLGEVLLLQFMPGDLDILPLYVLLLAIIPVVFWLYERSAWLLGAMAAGLWLVAGAGHLNLVNLALPTGSWYFDPLSWQLIFTLGILAGIQVKRGQNPFPYHRGLFALALTLVLVAIPLNLLIHFHFTGISGSAAYHALTSKTNNGLLRLLNALAIVYVVWNVEAIRRIDPRGMLRPIYAAGRNSLPTFVSGLVLSLMIAALMASGIAVPIALQLLMLVVGCAAQLAIALYADERTRRLRQEAESRRTVAAFPSAAPLK